MLVIMTIVIMSLVAMMTVIMRPVISGIVKNILDGREPWSSDYGKRLTFQRLWV